MSLKEFEHWRCRLQRLADAKPGSGWVGNVTASFIDVQLVGQNPYAENDVVCIEMGGRRRSVLIDAIVVAVSGQTIRLHATGEPKFLPAQSSSRRRVQRCEGTMTAQEGHDRYEIEVLDVSENGLGVLVDSDVAPRTVVVVAFRTEFGAVTCSAWVRYCRKDPDGSGFFRAGLEFVETGRPSKGHLDRMLEPPLFGSQVAS